MGLDRILSHAQVTKTTFYKYFDSKESFACEVLDLFADRLLRQIDTSPHWKNDQELRSQLLEIFSAWDQMQPDEIFRGCLLIAAAVSSGDPNDPARVRAIRHRQRVFDTVERIAREANFRDVEQFTARFSLILDSSLIARQLNGNQRMAGESLRMAEQLVNSAVSERGSTNHF